MAARSEGKCWMFTASLPGQIVFFVRILCCLILSAFHLLVFGCKSIYCKPFLFILTASVSHIRRALLFALALLTSEKTRRCSVRRGVPNTRWGTVRRGAPVIAKVNGPFKNCDDS